MHVISRRALTAAFAIGAIVLSHGMVACGEERPEESEASGEAPSPRAAVPSRQDVAPLESRYEISDTVQTLTGVLIMGDEVQVFRLCGLDEETWVRDYSGGSLGRAMRDLEVEMYQPVYVTVRGVVMPPFTAGPGVEYRSRLDVHEVVEVSVDTTRCQQSEEVNADASAQEALPMGDSELRASGNEPYWNLDVSREGIVFSRMGEEDLVFPYEASIQRHGLLVYSPPASGSPAREIEIVIEEKPCSDSMSGARFTHTAQVIFDGRIFRGCARRR